MRVCQFQPTVTSKSKILFINMRTVKSVYTLGLWLLAIQWCLAAEAPVELRPDSAPAPNWVAAVTFDWPKAAADATENLHGLLSDVQMNGVENEFYFHSVRQALTDAGVKTASETALDFDPDYQTLTLHWVRLWRGTNSANVIGDCKVMVAQLAPDQYLFGSGRRARLIVPGARPGDLIDWAYSVRGTNPVFAGKFSESLRLQFGWAMDHVFARVVWPSARPLCLKDHGEAGVQPTITRKQLWTEYRWDAKDVAAASREDMPWIQLSEYQSWAEVNQWAAWAFRDTNALSPELAQKINDWQKITVRRDQLQSVLQFVQGAVGYAPADDDAHSGKPSGADVVYKRGGGDDKDKVMLLLGILRTLRVEAWPVLVSTVNNMKWEKWQPTPQAFNHAIVQSQLNGVPVWLDPTRQFQGGSIEMRAAPEFERGLVVKPGTMSLTGFAPGPDTSDTQVTEYFNVQSRDLPAELKVVTAVTGREAEGLRATLAAGDLERIGTNSLKMYVSVYPGIKMAAPLAVVDDKAQNRLEVTESYLIDHFWIYDNVYGTYRGDFVPVKMREWMIKPTTTNSVEPIFLGKPRHASFRVEATLATPAVVSKENITVQDNAFVFRRDIFSEPRKLTLTYDYQTLTETVPPEGVTSYLHHQNDVEQSLYYWFVLQ